MNTALVEKAIANNKLMHLTGSGLACHRFTTVDGIAYAMERIHGKEWVRVTLNEFTRTFHGTATKATRKRAKSQMRQLMKTLLSDGWLVSPYYNEGRRLAGMVFAKRIPTPDDEGIADMIHDYINAAERRRDLHEERAQQLRESLNRAMCDIEDEPNENNK